MHQAFTSWAVLTELADSDVNRLKRLAVRFAKPVLPGEDLETRIWTKAQRQRQSPRYAFETARGEDVVITDGLAEISRRDARRPTMGALEGRVAVITGAGRGIGREHALLFASEGAQVVVNDLGGSNAGRAPTPARRSEVVDEIVAAGGTAVANTDNVATWDGAESAVQQAIDEFGRLDVVVNNAGILRDGFIAGLDEEQWDAVIAVHLKGHFAVLHHAAAYWKAQSKAGDQPIAAVINTASASGRTCPTPARSTTARPRRASRR